MSNGTIQIALGNMAVDATDTVTIAVQSTAPAGTTLTNTASVSGILTDPNTANNQSTVQTYIIPLASKRLLIGP